MNKKKIIWSIVSALVAIGIGLGAFTYVGYQHDMRMAYERIKTGGNTIIDTACGRIEYAAIGKGPPLLVVHGAGGGYDQGLWLAERLGTEGFRLISPSRFGYLGTPLPADASADAQADMYACLLDALNVHQVAVLGASAGAPSSLQFVLRHPERASSLVLLVPAAYAPPERSQSQIHAPVSDFVINVVLKSDFIVWLASKTARSILLNLIGVPPMVQAQLTLQQQQRLIETVLFPINPRQQGLMNDGIVVPREVMKRYPLEKIRVPTLVISAADDPYNTMGAAKFTAENIQGARFIGLAQGGHLFIGQERQVQSEVIAFLKQNTGSDITKEGK